MATVQSSVACSEVLANADERVAVTFMRLALNGEWQAPSRFVRFVTKTTLEPLRVFRR
jgi:hypothetical protein